jgi:hypothetical protein
MAILPSKPAAMLVCSGSSGAVLEEVVVAVEVETRVLLETGVLVGMIGVDDEGVGVEVGVTALTRTRVLVTVVVRVEVRASALASWVAPRKRTVETMVVSFMVMTRRSLFDLRIKNWS